MPPASDLRPAIDIPLERVAVQARVQRVSFRRRGPDKLHSHSLAFSAAANHRSAEPELLSWKKDRAFDGRPITKICAAQHHTVRRHILCNYERTFAANV